MLKQKQPNRAARADGRNPDTSGGVNEGENCANHPKQSDDDADYKVEPSPSPQCVPLGWTAWHTGHSQSAYRVGSQARLMTRMARTLADHSL